jgi:hypothetical protein
MKESKNPSTSLVPFNKLLKMSGKMGVAKSGNNIKITKLFHENLVFNRILARFCA